MRKPALLIAKSNAQISCAVTKQLISIFVLATWIVQSHFFMTTEKIKSNAIFIGRTPWFMSDFAGNSEERFSFDME